MFWHVWRSENSSWGSVLSFRTGISEPRTRQQTPFPAEPSGWPWLPISCLPWHLPGLPLLLLQVFFCVILQFSCDFSYHYFPSFSIFVFPVSCVPSVHPSFRPSSDYILAPPSLTGPPTSLAPTGSRVPHLCPSWGVTYLPHCLMDPRPPVLAVTPWPY